MEPFAIFRHPSVLFLLVLPAALLLWTWNRRGVSVALPFDHARHTTQRKLLALLASVASLPALVLGIAVVLLAGPQALSEPSSKRALTNIQFCVDVSGSMMEKFGAQDRYEAAMDAINGFLDYRKGDAFGLTFFGNTVLHWVPLTTDVSAFRCAPPFMHPRNLPNWFSGTSIAKALRACRTVLIEREEGDRMILLVSDGFSSDLSGGQDEVVARELAADGITVFAVHIAEGAIPKEIVRITALTGGEAFKPEDKDGLAHIFERIDQMKRARLEKTQPEASDAFAPYCLAGLAILVLMLLSAFGLRYTPW
ncbi:MAG: vWA domain-containing protein [Planctomycetota bacterium]|mgnify:CR=1 FL=1|nr:vWA domain-containing protein [Planctomycetota bacterium]